MFENVTLTLGTIENPFNLTTFLLSTIVQASLILLTVILTVYYSGHYKEKKHFEATVTWFFTELIFIESNLQLLKRNAESLKTTLKNKPEKPVFTPLAFPKREFDSYNDLISNDYQLYIKKDEVVAMAILYSHFEDITNVKKALDNISLFLINNVNVDKTYNETTAHIIEQLICSIDRFHEQYEKIQKYPLPEYPSFSKLIVASIRKRYFKIHDLIVKT